jgi:hypothetical protein
MRWNVCAAVGVAVAMVLAMSVAMVGESAGPKRLMLLLYEKTPSGEWPIVEGGAWGTLHYSTYGDEFEFKFNGHDYTNDENGILVDTSYTLIYYPDPWPGTGLIKLGEGTSHLCYLDNPYVMIQIVGSCDTGDLENAKIWLVLSDDLGEDKMTGWNPAKYLFENELINFEDTSD